MGLDLVELVMKVENVFGIDILDNDAPHLGTPRQLANYISYRISCGKTPTSDRLVSQSRFYALRNILAQQFDIPIQNIRPETRFDQLFQNDPIKQWERLNTILGNIVNFEYRRIGYIPFTSDTVVEPPTSIQTIQDLLPFIQHTPFEWENDPYLQSILQQIIRITSDQLAIPIERIHPDSHFVKDLDAS